MQVQSIALPDLLNEFSSPKTIDYLSIDTEGSEYEILSAMDFQDTQVKLITVEHAGDQEKRNKIFKLLSKNGYRRWHPEFTKWDDWYVLDFSK